MENEKNQKSKAMKLAIHFCELLNIAKTILSKNEYASLLQSISVGAYLLIVEAKQKEFVKNLIGDCCAENPKTKVEYERKKELLENMCKRIFDCEKKRSESFPLTRDELKSICKKGK
jgi:hypothetical protein